MLYSLSYGKSLLILLKKKIETHSLVLSICTYWPGKDLLKLTQGVMQA